MTTFLLIRHATTDAVGKRLAGRAAGMHLNKEGIMQARLLAGRIHHLPIRNLYTSPLERAIETAMPVAEKRDIKPVICEEITEMECGEWTNRDFENLRNDPGFRLFNSMRSITRIPGGELMIEVQHRMITKIEQLKKKHAGELVAMVSHSDPIKAVIAYYAGIPLDFLQRMEISPASVSIIRFFEESVHLLQVNHTAEINIS